MNAETLTEIQQEIIALQALTQEVAQEFPNDAALAAFWHKLAHFGEKVDEWREKAQGGRDGQ